MPCCTAVIRYRFCRHKIDLHCADSTGDDISCQHCMRRVLVMTEYAGFCEKCYTEEFKKADAYREVQSRAVRRKLRDSEYAAKEKVQDILAEMKQRTVADDERLDHLLLRNVEEIQQAACWTQQLAQLIWAYKYDPEVEAGDALMLLNELRGSLSPKLVVRYLGVSLRKMQEHYEALLGETEGEDEDDEGFIPHTPQTTPEVVVPEGSQESEDGVCTEDDDATEDECTDDAE